MPLAAFRPCNAPGCPELIRGQPYCSKHTAQRHAEDRQRRGSSSERGYGSRWQKYRKAYLARHPLCVMCRDEGRVGAAEVVDHVQDHKGNAALFWNPDNHRALCKRHHDLRTDGGDFGRK